MENSILAPLENDAHNQSHSKNVSSSEPQSPSNRSDDKTKKPMDICSACQLSISNTEAISCRDKFFHVNCFKCDKCGTQLSPNSKIIVSPDEKFSCMNCSVKCHACTDIILDSAVTTSRHTYHMACFTCTRCRQPIQNFTYAYFEDSLQCVPCYRVQKINSFNLPTPTRKLLIEANSDSPIRDRFSINHAKPDSFVSELEGTRYLQQQPETSTSQPQSQQQIHKEVLGQQESKHLHLDSTDSSDENKQNNTSVSSLNGSISGQRESILSHPSAQGVASPRVRKPVADQKRVFESLMNSPLWNDKRKTFNEFAVNSSLGGSTSRSGSSENLQTLGSRVSEYRKQFEQKAGSSPPNSVGNLSGGSLGARVRGSDTDVNDTKTLRSSVTVSRFESLAKTVSSSSITGIEEGKGLVQSRRTQFNKSYEEQVNRQSQPSNLKSSKSSIIDDSRATKPTLTTDTTALPVFRADSGSSSNTQKKPAILAPVLSSSPQSFSITPSSASQKHLDSINGGVNKSKSLLEPLSQIVHSESELPTRGASMEGVVVTDSPFHEMGSRGHTRSKDNHSQHHKTEKSNDGSNEMIARLTAEIDHLKSELYEIYEAKGTLEQMREEIKEIQELKYQKESLMNMISDRKAYLEQLNTEVQTCVSGLVSKLQKSLNDDSLQITIAKDLEKILDTFKENIINLEQERNRLLAETQPISSSRKKQSDETSSHQKKPVSQSGLISYNTQSKDLHHSKEDDVDNVPTVNPHTKNLPALPTSHSRQTSGTTADDISLDTINPNVSRVSHTSPRRRSKTVSSTCPAQEMLTEEVEPMGSQPCLATGASGSTSETVPTVSVLNSINNTSGTANTTSVSSTGTTKKWAQSFLAKAVGSGSGSFRASTKDLTSSQPQLNSSTPPVTVQPNSISSSLNNSFANLHKGLSRRVGGATSESSADVVERPYHKFLPHSYISPRKCDCCGDTVWGKELKCDHCGYHSHSKCSAKVTGTCINKRSQSSMGSIDLLATGGPITYGTTMKNIVRQEGRTIPVFIERCIQAVEAKGLDYEGVYRKSGPSSQISKIIGSLKRGEDVMFESSAESMPSQSTMIVSTSDTAAITSALKQYLRDLSEPLISSEAYVSLIETMRHDAGEIRDQKLIVLIRNLPEENQGVLGYLFRHLHKVQCRSSKNLMTASNLGVVFGPTLLRPHSQIPLSTSSQPSSQTSSASAHAAILAQQTDLVDAPVKCALVEHLILHVDRFFPRTQIVTEAIAVTVKSSPDGQQASSVVGPPQPQGQMKVTVPLP